jgi:hypothetical protein
LEKETSTLDSRGIKESTQMLKYSKEYRRLLIMNANQLFLSVGYGGSAVLANAGVAVGMQEFPHEKLDQLNNPILGKNNSWRKPFPYQIVGDKGKECLRFSIDKYWLKAAGFIKTKNTTMNSPLSDVMNEYMISNRSGDVVFRAILQTPVLFSLMKTDQATLHFDIELHGPFF